MQPVITDIVTEAVDKAVRAEQTRIWLQNNGSRPGLRRSYLRRAMAPLVFHGHRWRFPWLSR
jgi:hypothetical protein